MPHQNPTIQSRFACAPYNFIPLPERVVRAVDSIQALPQHNRFDTRNYPHSGYLEIELTTESPLYIRGPLNRRELGFDLDRKYRDGQGDILPNNPEYQRLAKNKPDFFYIDPQTKKPVIPGSSLRGMLRSIFEIITYSKFERFDDRKIIYRDVAGSNSLAESYRQKLLGKNQAHGHQMAFEYPHPDVRGGYLVKTSNGDWAIQPAICNETTLNESFVHVECGPAAPNVSPVSVQPVARDWTVRSNPNLRLNIAFANLGFVAGHGQGNPYLNAWLVKTRDVGGHKHMQRAVYEPDWKSEPILIPDDLMKLYQDDCEIPRSQNTATRDLLQEYQLGANLDEQGRIIVPLFYRLDEEGKLYYFGSTLMFRLPYQTTIKDCVPVELRSGEVIDLSDSVFGFIEHPDGESKKGYSSKLRFSQGTLVTPPDDWQLRMNPPMTPRILSSPKPTCFQHYLEQDSPDQAGTLVHYDVPDQMPLLRGTKRNWHQRRNWGNQNEAISALENTDQNLSNTQKTFMQPTRGGADREGNHQGTKFVFRIDFNNLNDVELGGLLWAIDPVGNQGRAAGGIQYGHKLGMGKPYGMGSVSLKITKCVVSDRKSRYTRLISDEGVWHQPISELENDVQQEKKRQFEQYILTQLGLDPQSQLSQVRRIAMLLKMLELPGPAVTPVNPQVGAVQQHRQGNTRYMTINIGQNLRPNQRNEYRDRPVLPDPSDWMTDQEKQWAILQPAPAPVMEQVNEPPFELGRADEAVPAEDPIQLAADDGISDFPRFKEGNVIKLSISEEWIEKKGKRKLRKIYTASDGARATYDGHTPELQPGQTECLGRITAIENVPNNQRYKVQVV